MKNYSEYNYEPEVIILLATYNGGHYLTEQLLSLQAQTHQDFRCYIHDDASTDGTMKIVSDFCTKDPSHFAVLEGPPCGGAKENFMFMLRNAPSASYIMFCDQDDVWHEDKIAVTLNAMKECERTSTVVCVHSDVEIVDAALTPLCSSFYQYANIEPQPRNYWWLLQGNVAIGCTIMLNRACREKCCLLEDDSSIYMHDWWCALIAYAFGTLYFIDKPLLKYRRHGGNVTDVSENKNIFALCFSYFKRSTWIESKRLFSQGKHYFSCHSKLLEALMNEDHPLKPLLHEWAKSDSYGKCKRIILYWKCGLLSKRSLLKILLF